MMEKQPANKPKPKLLLAVPERKRRMEKRLKRS